MRTSEDVKKMVNDEFLNRISPLIVGENSILKCNDREVAVVLAKDIKEAYQRFFEYAETLAYTKSDDSTNNWEYPSDFFTRDNSDRKEKLYEMVNSIDIIIDASKWRTDESLLNSIYNNILNNYNYLKENLNKAKADLLNESRILKEEIKKLTDYFFKEIATGVPLLNPANVNENSTEYKDVKTVYDDIANLKKDFEEQERNTEFSVAGMQEFNEEINRIYQDITEKQIRLKAIAYKVDRLKNDSSLKVSTLNKFFKSEDDKIKSETKKILSDIYKLLAEEIRIKEEQIKVFLPKEKNALIKAIENIDKKINRIEKNGRNIRISLGDKTFSEYKDSFEIAKEILNKKREEISNKLRTDYNYIYGDSNTNLQSGDNKKNGSTIKGKGKEKGKKKEANINKRNEASTSTKNSNEPSAPPKSVAFSLSEDTQYTPPEVDSSFSWDLPPYSGPSAENVQSAQNSNEPSAPSVAEVIGLSSKLSIAEMPFSSVQPPYTDKPEQLKTHKKIGPIITDKNILKVIEFDMKIKSPMDAYTKRDDLENLKKAYKEILNIDVPAESFYCGFDERQKYLGGILSVVDNVNMSSEDKKTSINENLKNLEEVLKNSRNMFYQSMGISKSY